MNYYPQIINPKDWILSTIFVRNDKSLLYNVLPIIDEYTLEEDKIILRSKKWILKLSDYPEELEVIKSLKLYENNLCIVIDKDNLYCNDKTKRYYYIMEKYDNNLYDNYQYAKDNLMKLGRYMINFFEWLHVENKLVHGDIKPNNIVFKVSNENSPFKVIDYENIRTQTNKYICNELNNDNYYYYHLGCEYNKPYNSYRMDLQSFGYILYSIAASNDSYFRFDWQKKAIEYYERQKNYNSYYALEINKSHYGKGEGLENSKYKDIVLKYFDVIKNQDWEEDPNIEVYKELKELFTEVQNTI